MRHLTKKGLAMKDIIAEITTYMREHSDRELSIEDLAEQFGYSKFHFSREFKKIIGVTPNEYWAALKMEQSLLELQRSSSILNAQLKTGYQSSGTFSTNFLKTTGLTPNQYKKEMKKFGLFNTIKAHEAKESSILTHYSFDRKNIETFQKHKLNITCNTPKDFKGTIFVGLFEKPLPNVAPIIGKALFKNNNCVIDQIPNGEYYPLCCAIRNSLNPLDYFFLKNALRDLHRTPICFPLEQDSEIYFNLRDPLPTDPAIPTNLIKLVVDALTRKEK